MIDEFNNVDYVPFQNVTEHDVLVAEFFSKCRVAESGCWIWIGRRTTGGYGSIGRGKDKLAHRLAYRLFKGEVPKDLWVLHSCDTPSCCNPAHLRAGTPKDNVADCKERGRLNRPSRGARNQLAKLTDADVLDIRNSTLSSKALAAKYGIDRTNVHAIVAGKTWTHVPMPAVRVEKADGRAKLKPEQVLAIRSSDASLGELAQAYGVGKPLVSMIRNGRIWKNVAASVEESA